MSYSSNYNNGQRDASNGYDRPAQFPTYAASQAYQAGVNAWNAGKK